MKEAGWKSGFCWDELNTVTDGCKLTMGLVLTEIPESPAGNRDVDAETKSPLDDAPKLARSPGAVDPSGRSVMMTLIKSSRHKLVAKPPITPGLA